MKYINIEFDGSVNNSSPFLLQGTSLMGNIDTKYAKLVNVFGEPNGRVGDKTDAEWVIYTLAGIASIYNYKDCKNYLGEEGEEVENITDWHIGGLNERVVNWITVALEN